MNTEALQHVFRRAIEAESWVSIRMKDVSLFFQPETLETSDPAAAGPVEGVVSVSGVLRRGMDDPPPPTRAESDSGAEMRERLRDVSGYRNGVLVLDPAAVEAVFIHEGSGPRAEGAGVPARLEPRGSQPPATRADSQGETKA